MKAKYNIGTKFKTSNKHPRFCEVVDIHYTYNHAGDLVKIRYVAVHETMGRKVVDREVVETTIAKGLISAGPRGLKQVFIERLESEPFIVGSCAICGHGLPIFARGGEVYINTGCGCVGQPVPDKKFNVDRLLEDSDEMNKIKEFCNGQS